MALADDISDDQGGIESSPANEEVQVRTLSK